MFARRSSIFLVLAATSMCGHASPSSPSTIRGVRTVYVSPGGNNRNSGAIGDPWQTMRYALAQLQAGDTLYIRGGTYTGGENTLDSQSGTVRSGTSWSNPITIAAYPSETVTIQPPDGQSGIRFTTGAPSYVIVQDLVIDMGNQSVGGGTGPTGVYVGNGSNHNRFQRLEVMSNQGNGIGISDANGNSSFNEILNCRIHDNGRYPGVNQGYGAYVSASDTLMDGNDVYNNGGYGLHFYNDAGAFNVARNIIRNNTIHDNGTHGGTNYGVVIAWGDGNQVYGNRIYGNRGGILVYTNSTNAKVYNNTIYGNGPFANILIQYAVGTIIGDNVIDASTIVDMGNGTQLSSHR